MAARRRVVFVTTHWGEDEDETTLATRLVAGALARTADIHVVHLVDEVDQPGPITDSVFTVYRIARRGAHLLRAGIFRAALAGYDGGQHVPSAAATLLGDYEGDTPEVISLVKSLSPDAVVLAGYRQPYDIAALIESFGPNRPRIIFLPFTADHSKLASNFVQRALKLADVIGIAHEGERHAIADELGGRNDSVVVPLDLALPINRSGTTQGLFGVRFFGLYVLLIRNFPVGGPRYERSATHEVLRTVLGNVSVAEVDGEKWRISDRENTLEFPVTPSRVNLWRLMAHAIATVDVRPPGPIGREAIESMLLGTPVVVPHHSAAMEHAKAANGGLWYRDIGELFDTSRAIMNPHLRAKLTSQGREYTERHHGRMDDFAVRMAELVFNTTPGQTHAATESNNN